MLCDVTYNMLAKVGFYEVKPSTMKTGLTIKQAAERYGISVPSIYNLIRAGKVDTQKHPEHGTIVSKEGMDSALNGICPQCGKGFKKGTQRQRFCSPNCRKETFRAK